MGLDPRLNRLSKFPAVLLSGWLYSTPAPLPVQFLFAAALTKTVLSFRLMFYKLTSREVGRFQLLELEKYLEAEFWSWLRTGDSAAWSLGTQMLPGNSTVVTSDLRLSQPP